MPDGLPKYIQIVNGIPYFRRVTKSKGAITTRRYRMPPMESPKFAVRYQELLHDRPDYSPLSGSIAELVTLYKWSDDYRMLKASTRYHRNRYLKMVEDDHGTKDYTTLTKGKVKEIRGKLVDTPGKANNYITTLSLLYKCAMDNDLVQFNPCADLKPLELGEHQPWPEALIEKALETAEPLTRLAIVLCLYTGQRIGDVCAMERSHIKDDVIQVVQEKTGKTVWVPLHYRLKEELARDKTPHVQWLLYNENGGRMRPRTLQRRLDDLREKMEIEYVWHGLRKNSVNALLEAGCTPGEVSAITGQSMKMIEHYAKEVNVKKMAKSAVKKWEQA